MKQMLKGFLCVGVLLSTAAANAATTSGKSFFAHRSQGSNTARELSLMSNHINEFDMDKVYGSFSAVLEFTRSFDRKEIGKYLFFNGSNTMRFATVPVGATPAAAIAGIPAGTDVNAANFGIGDNFVSDVTALPRVENFIVDFNLFIGLDEWVEGMYFRINTPLVWTRWKMNLKEDQVTASGGNFVECRMDVVAGVTPEGSNSVIDAWKGQGLFGDMQTAWLYGKIDDTKDNSKTRLADIEAVFGWNFVSKEKGYLGLGILGVAPTGNKPDPTYMFGPVAGDYHWKLGGRIDAKAVLWDKDDDQCLSMYIDAKLAHLFKRTQKRSFDFTVNGKGSRYLLLKKLDAAGAYVDGNNLINAINIVTLDSKVRVDFEGDASLMFSYKNGGMTFDLGYNIWGRTKEKIDITGEITPNTYAFMGDVQGDAVGNTNVVAIAAGNVATQCATTITITGAADNLAAMNAAANQIKTADLDKSSAEAPSALSHKVFGDLAYNWWDNDYSPYIGVGGEIEFSGDDNNALDQWGIFLKGGFDF